MSSEQSVTPRGVSEGRKTRGHRRLGLLIAGAIALVICLIVLTGVPDDHDGLGLITSGGQVGWTYLATAGLIFADAVIPVFPGETTLNAASTLAAQGHLEIWLVILAGAVGAIAGDSALYWIARRSGDLVEDRVEQLRGNPKVAGALDYIGGSEPVMIVAGRYVPGVRFLINATLGVAKYPYRRFLLWSAIGGVIWSAYTSLLAYWIGSVLEEYPLASVVISGAVTTAAIAILFLVKRRADAPPPHTGSPAAS